MSEEQIPTAEGWFTEIAEEAGLAMSLKLEERVHEETTEYQHIAIYETTGFGTLMVIDGFVMLTDRDNFVYHEMMSHPVLFSHPDPKTVVIIGGGDCGTLREVLKHPGVERCVQVEIDERVTRLSEQYFPDLCEANDDARAELLFVDGVRWMANAAPGSVDVVIVDSTDPIGPAEGLFAEPFYRSCLAALGEGGLLVQQSESPLLHMGILRRMRASMRAAGFDDVATLGFPQATYPSGWWSCTQACKGGSVPDPRDEAGSPGFHTRYYTVDVHRAARAMPAFFLEAEAAGEV